MKLHDVSYDSKWQKLKNKDEIIPSKRLIYELGYYDTLDRWHRTGVMKEVMDPIELKNDNRFNDLEFITHHNFFIEV